MAVKYSEVEAIEAANGRTDIELSGKSPELNSVGSFGARGIL